MATALTVCPKNSISSPPASFSASYGVPVFFIEGSYQASLWAQHPIFAANFFVGIIPLALIMNFLVYKNGRSITLIALFHVLVNYSSELFETSQVSKDIFTLILTAVALLIVLRNKEFFFKDKMDLSISDTQPAAKETVSLDPA